MGGNAGVGHLVHFFGADLHFDGDTVHTHQYRVQRLVAIGLGDGNVVLKLGNYRLVEVVHRPQDSVAGVDTVDNDAKGVDVHDFIERLFLVAHLLINAEQVFFPSDHQRVDVLTLKAQLNGVLNFLDQLFAIAARGFQGGL